MIGRANQEFIISMLCLASLDVSSLCTSSVTLWQVFVVKFLPLVVQCIFEGSSALDLICNTCSEMCEALPFLDAGRL